MPQFMWGSCLLSESEISVGVAGFPETRPPYVRETYN